MRKENVTVTLHKENQPMVDGFENLIYVHFRIDVPFYVSSLCDNSYADKASVSVARFKEEMTKIFSDAGWTLKNHTCSGSCPDLYKGGEHIYCHPQDLSGALSRESLVMVEQLLSDCESCTLYHIDNYGYEVVVHNEEDSTRLYETLYGSSINDTIREYTTTKRCNLYKRECDVLWKLYEHIHIRTSNVQGLTNGYVEYKWLLSKFDELVNSGLLVRKDKYIRWASKKELKALTKAA